jgi:hypothetical protein
VNDDERRSANKASQAASDRAWRDGRIRKLDAQHADRIRKLDAMRETLSPEKPVQASKQRPPERITLAVRVQLKKVRLQLLAIAGVLTRLLGEPDTTVGKPVRGATVASASQAELKLALKQLYACRNAWYRATGEYPEGIGAAINHVEFVRDHLMTGLVTPASGE